MARGARGQGAVSSAGRARKRTQVAQSELGERVCAISRFQQSRPTRALQALRTHAHGAGKCKRINRSVKREEEAQCVCLVAHCSTVPQRSDLSRSRDKPACSAHGMTKSWQFQTCKWLLDSSITHDIPHPTKVLGRYSCAGPKSAGARAEVPHVGVARELAGCINP